MLALSYLASNFLDYIDFDLSALGFCHNLSHQHGEKFLTEKELKKTKEVLENSYKN